MKKKLLIVLFATLMLTACGAKDQPTPKAETITAETTTAAETTVAETTAAETTAAETTAAETTAAEITTGETNKKTTVVETTVAEETIIKDIIKTEELNNGAFEFTEAEKEKLEEEHGVTVEKPAESTQKPAQENNTTNSGPSQELLEQKMEFEVNGQTITMTVAEFSSLPEDHQMAYLSGMTPEEYIARMNKLIEDAPGVAAGVTQEEIDAFNKSNQ